jgi:hypothetical protein
MIPSSKEHTHYTISKQNTLMALLFHTAARHATAAFKSKADVKRTSPGLVLLTLRGHSTSMDFTIRRT